VNSLPELERKEIYRKIWTKNRDVPGNVSGTSREAINFFKRLISLVDLRGDEYYFHNGEQNSEWWIRDFEDRKKFYFLDFFIPSISLAIEYNGIGWH